jgi:hypothetical protein
VTPGDALQDTKARAPIVAFSDSGTRPFAVADLTAAYPGAARRILRGVAMIDRSVVLVQDEFTALGPGTPVRWVMMTGARIRLSADGRSAALSSDGRLLRADVLAPRDGRFGIGTAEPPTPSEARNAGDSVLSLDIPPRDATADLTIAVALAPVGARWGRTPAPAVRDLADWR